jgi:hypothetical protein
MINTYLYSEVGASPAFGNEIWPTLKIDFVVVVENGKLQKKISGCESGRTSREKILCMHDVENRSCKTGCISSDLDPLVTMTHGCMPPT